MNVNDFTSNPSAKKFAEQVESATNDLSAKARRLIDDADGKRVVIKDSHGKELLAVPLTYGVVGGALAALAAPQLAAVAAVGGYFAKLKVSVEPANHVISQHLADNEQPDGEPEFVDTAPVTSQNAENARADFHHEERTQPEEGFNPERAVDNGEDVPKHSPEF